jgi:uncharacterized protein YceH (UPF0502 family)
MQPPFSHVEVRVVGSLLEKAVTTPDAYPLSLTALTAACNQTSNREPVMRLDEEAVNGAVVALRRRSLVRAIQPSGSRVTKYLHLLDEALDLDARELAILGVLMLRGPQTSGELNARTARLADFDGLASVEATLERLLTRDAASLVTRLTRRPGQKESRYAQLLGGEVVESLEEPPLAAAEEVSRLASLEGQVQQLQAELTALRAAFDTFRAQF